MQSLDVTKKTEVRKPIDWDALFLQFAKQEETTSARSFLRTLGWTEPQLAMGSTQLHVKNWKQNRAELRQKIIDEQMHDAKAAFSELLPQLVAQKRKIFMRYLKELENPKLDLKTLSHILTKIKTELGEPAIITKQNTEDVGEHKDPALAFLIAMGVFTDGRPAEPTTAERSSEAETSPAVRHGTSAKAAS